MLKFDLPLHTATVDTIRAPFTVVRVTLRLTIEKPLIITGSNTASIQACMRLKRRYANHPGCGKAYTSANGLKQHLIAHQGKTHCCDELSFNPISTHTGERPYENRIPPLPKEH